VVTRGLTGLFPGVTVLTLLKNDTTKSANSKLNLIIAKISLTAVTLRA
jgi:hypothetical protein